MISVSFTLGSTPYTIINGGPQFQLSPAASIVVACEGQTEVDRVWSALLEGGTALQCEWLTDRYGLCWQIVPQVLYAMLDAPDRDRARRVSEAMLDMVKLDQAVLQAAYDGI